MLAEAWSGKVPLVEATVGISSATSAEVVVPLLRGVEAGGPVVVALGTNDDPSTLARFEGTIRKVVSAAPGCVVWLTIHRVESSGSWEPFNEVLRKVDRETDRLVLAGWAGMVARDGSLVYSDGVHPTPSGVRALARAVSTAALGCPT